MLLSKLRRGVFNGNHLLLFRDEQISQYIHPTAVRSIKNVCPERIGETPSFTGCGSLSFQQSKDMPELQR